MAKKMKHCSECNNEFAEEEFPIREYKKDGSPSRRSICRSCLSEINRGKRVASKSIKYRLDNQMVVETQSTNDEKDTEALIMALVELARHEPQRLNTISKEAFLKYTNYDKDFSFTDLKELAFKWLDNAGEGNPSEVTIQEDGDYLIIGDTFGCHTRSNMFDLINNIISECDIKHLIVVGRQLDDDGSLSDAFKTISIPITFVATMDEIADLHKLKDSYGFNIVRNKVNIGDVTIRNQEQLGNYIQKSITSLDPIIFKGNCIVNCTRFEYGMRAGGFNPSWIGSPGTLAEPHVRTLINKLCFSDGMKVKQVFHSSYNIYRRREEQKERWEQGAIILTKKGYTSIPLMLPIKNIDDEYFTAIAGKIISSEGVFESESTHIIISDTHIPEQDEYALSVVENVMNGIKFDNFAIIGDILTGSCVNHHVLSKGEVPEFSLKEEMMNYNRILNRLSDIVKSNNARFIVMKGNHDDFYSRWGKKNPAFKSFLESMIDSVLFECCDDFIEDKDYTYIGENTVLAHGDAFIGGISGNNLEQTARMFPDNNCIVGHSHSPLIRFGSVRTGCMCYDSEYADPMFSNWDRSFAIISSYKGMDITNLIHIVSKVTTDGCKCSSFLPSIGEFYSTYDELDVSDFKCKFILQ